MMKLPLRTSTFSSISPFLLKGQILLAFLCLILTQQIGHTQCAKSLGNAQVLCYSPNGNGSTTVFLAEGNNIVQKVLDKNGATLSSTSAGTLTKDSVLVRNNQVIKKLVNGTIAYTKTIPPSVLSRAPSINAAVEMTDGTFVLGGYQKIIDPVFSPNNKDSLVLITTDANLNFQNSIVHARSSGPYTPQLDALVQLIPLPNNQFLATYYLGFVGIINRASFNFSTFQKTGANLAVIKSGAYGYREQNQPIITSVCGKNMILHGDISTYGQKGSFRGVGDAFFNIDSLFPVISKTFGEGSVDYYGPYRTYSYFYKPLLRDTAFQLSVNAYGDPRISMNNFTQLEVKFYDNNNTPNHAKIIPFVAFDHVIRTGDTTCLVFMTENGQLKVYNPDCNNVQNLPDLTLANVNMTTPSVQQGQILNWKVDIKNIGTAAATANFTVKAYISKDTILSADDVQDGIIPTGNFAAGLVQTQVAGASTIAPTVAAGQYYLILKVDADNGILESNENNNILVSTSTFAVTAVPSLCYPRFNISGVNITSCLPTANNVQPAAYYSGFFQMRGQKIADGFTMTVTNGDTYTRTTTLFAQSPPTTTPPIGSRFKPCTTENWLYFTLNGVGKRFYESYLDSNVFVRVHYWGSETNPESVFIEFDSSTTISRLPFYSFSKTLNCNPCFANDRTPPVFNCPTSTVQFTGTNPNGYINIDILLAGINVSSTDNCGNNSLIYGMKSLSNVKRGLVYPIHLVAYDSAGNKTVCDFNLRNICTVTSVTTQFANCPRDTNISIGNGQNCKIYNWVEPKLAVSTGEPVRISKNYSSGYCFPIGSTTVIYTATDSCGNTSTCSFKVTITGALPDLIAHSIVLPNPTVQAGQNLSLRFGLQNLGTSNANSFFTRFYISKDNLLSADDIQSGYASTGELIGGWNVPSIVGDFPIPATLAAGQYYLILKVDADSQITESNETNNVLASASTFTVTPVQTGSYCGSKGIAPWELWTRNVTFNTLNNTSEKFKDYATLGFSNYTNLLTTVNKGETYPLSILPPTGWNGYFSNVFCRVWIDFNKNNVFEDNEKVLEGTNANVFTTNVLIPTTTATGSVRMRVSMKWGGYPTPCETFDKGEVEDYTINIAGGTTSNLPDLTVTFSSAYQCGGTHACTDGFSGINVRIKNQGTAAAASTSLKFYQSVDETFDASDTPLLIGSKSNPNPQCGGLPYGTEILIPNLAAGASLDTFIYAGQPSNVYWIAKTDANNAISENNENNNTFAQCYKPSLNGITTAVGQDTFRTNLATANQLQISYLAAINPYCLSGANYIGLTNNQLAYYLSTDTVISANDIVVPFTLTGMLNFGIHQTEVIVPNTVASGVYYLIAKATVQDVCGSSPNTRATFRRVIVVNSSVTNTNDIALSLTSTPSVFTKYTPLNFTVSAKNTGNQVFTNVKIEFKFPIGTTNGGAATPSFGTWQEWCAGGTQCFTWTIPTLAANANATLNVPVYVLNPTSPMVATAKLLSSTPVDNVVANNTATISLNTAPPPARSIQAQPTQLIPIVVDKISPSPSDGEVTIELESLDSREVRFDFSDAFGKTLKTEIRKVEKGTNRVLFEVFDLPQGIYFVSPSTNKGKNVPTKFVKM